MFQFVSFYLILSQILVKIRYIYLFLQKNQSHETH